MKKLFTYLIAIIFFGSLNAQSSFINEDFSTFTDTILPPATSGWSNVDSSITRNGQVWRFDNPDSRVLNTPISDPAAIADSDWYGIGNTQDTYLETATFDASLASVVLLEFDYFFRQITGSYGLVQVYDGAKWVTVDSIATSQDPDHKILNISSQAAGNANAQVRFRFVGDWSWYWILDNVEIYEPAPEDIKVLSADSLITSCALTSAETITTTITNVGTTPISSLTLNYIVNGGTPVSEVYNNVIQPGDTVQYTFTQTVDFSQIGTYDVTIYSRLRADINFSNDTARGTAIQKSSVSTFPYFEDFESGTGNWTSGGILSSWAHGTPAGAVISSAYSGSNAWVTNLSGDYTNNEKSYVVSPCFDFTSLNAPQLKMRIFVESENSWDGAVLQSTIDGGLTWQKVGDYLDPNNWYNDNSISGLTALEPTQEGWTGVASNNGTGSWVLAEHVLNGLAGEPSVEFRIAFGTDGSGIEEGFAFDDILIQDAPAEDVLVSSVVAPLSNCALGNADSVKVQLVNAGSSALTNIPISYVLNNGTTIMETVPGPINPGDTLIYAFNTTVNVSTFGTYNLVVYSSVLTDPNQLNDTTYHTFDNVPLITSVPYAEGFESGNGGWTSYGANSTWGHGTPSGSYIPSAANGTNAWVTNLSGQYNNNELSYLESPCLDFTSLTSDPILSFSHIFNTESCCDEGWVELSLNGGQTWTKVLASTNAVNWYNDLGNQWWDGDHAAGSGIWHTASTELIGVSGSSNVKVRFVFSSDGSAVRDGFGVDNVRIAEPATDDAAMVSIDGPSSSCTLGASESISISLANLGIASFGNLSVSYSVNGGTPVTETLAGPVLSGDTVPFNFSNTVDLSTPGVYTLTVYVSLPNDPNQLNDTITVMIENIPVISTLPYTEDFETSSGAWTAYGTSSSWAHGAPAGVYINSAAGGNNAWVTNLTGDYNNNELSYLESPCLDFSALTVDPTLSFSHIFNTESCCDEGWVEVSLNSGQTWTKLLASSTAVNWYNDLGNQWWDGDHLAGTGAWHLASNTLTGVAGSANVKIRFVFSSDGSAVNDGFGVDNISIAPPASDDASLVSIEGPLSGCGLSANENISISVANVGTAGFSNLSVSYTLNGGTATSETIPGTLNSGDTIPYTFTNTINLSNPGTYTLVVYVSLPNDPNQFNDTIRVTINNVPVLSSIPYNEGFESGTGGWTTYGTASSWAHGTPSGPYISAAANGTNAWVTNLAGDYNNNEFSYLESPCFDFSAMSLDPVLSFSHMYNTESCCDEGWVEISTDGGNTWTKLLPNSSSFNWYNNMTNQWWNGDHAAGSGNWHLASSTLSGAAGSTSVKIRFAFSSDGSSVRDGFGVDDVSITPPAANDAEIVDLITPGKGCNFSSTDSVRVSFTNVGTSAITSLDLSYSVNGGSYITETYIGNLLSGDTAEYTFISNVNLSNIGTYTFDIACNLTGDPNVQNDSIKGIDVINSLTSIPYVEDFDALASGVTGVLSNGWVVTPSSNGNFEWITNIGATTTTASGPTGDNTTGSNTYIYTEASTPAAAGDETILTSPCIDISSNTGDLTMIYHYHMFGLDIQTLYLDIDTNGTWLTIDSIVGQVQTANADPYHFQVLNLNRFASLSTIKFRFRTTRGASYDGDIALDDISVTGLPVGLEDVEKTANKLAFYPNPSNGDVKLLKNSDIQIDRLEVYNLNGQMVMNLTEGLNQNFLQIDMSHLPKGVYTIKSFGEQFTQTDKLIIQ